MHAQSVAVVMSRRRKRAHSSDKGGSAHLFGTVIEDIAQNHVPLATLAGDRLLSPARVPTGALLRKDYGKVFHVSKVGLDYNLRTVRAGERFYKQRVRAKVNVHNTLLGIGQRLKGMVPR